MAELSDELTDQQWAMVDAIEQQRIRAIDSVSESVVAIYGENRQGGGSGVLIHPSGIALTNHHVIMGAGVSGWGGIADGKLYHWKLIGTDPGGDVSLIQMEGKDPFPFARLGNSDSVQIGDWALVMGNPFVLTEDQFPTVTLGIVSGVKRYQPGAGANQLVYGNCIQVDSSINPGNSGGPLFNFSSQVIGINGRGSFRDRGRVNVGLGYAISSNQIKNFIPDLLATKLVEHGTLDASFSERKGRIVCARINQEAPVAALGLDIGDELIEFEGEIIKTANQFTNLICTLPADWPAHLKIRKPDQTVHDISTRLLGLPYPKPKAPSQKDQEEKQEEQPEREGSEDPQPAPEDGELQQKAMRELLSSPAGQVRFSDVNRRYADQILSEWTRQTGTRIPKETTACLRVRDDLQINGKVVGSQELQLFTDGRFHIAWTEDGKKTNYWHDGTKFFMQPETGNQQEMTLVEAKLALPIVQAVGMLAPNLDRPWAAFGQHLIDGSDKAQRKVAYRMMVSDDASDKFFYWLSFEDEVGKPWYQLAKASAERDLENGGGVIFANWKLLPNDQGIAAENHLRLFVPLERNFVKGLTENKLLDIVNRKTEWVAAQFPR
jgi:S1-C subfamily serine protease